MKAWTLEFLSAFTEPVEVPAGEEFIEDLTRFRWHRRIDRDARAIQLVKKAKGYTCEVCGFNFESRYGELGKDFIEIHHLVPISELRGLMVSSHPEHDYAALCSNCHSMIHRMKVVHDIEALRAPTDENGLLISEFIGSTKSSVFAQILQGLLVVLSRFAA